MQLRNMVMFPASAPESASDVLIHLPPMTARSVLASALLGEDPPELPVAHLVLLAELFGINPNRSRVALSRMVASGEATTDGAATYRLAGRLLERRDRQGDSLVGRTRKWDGRWRMVVVTTTGSSAELRADRRRRLGLARLAEQREGVWLRPDNIDLRPDPGDDPDLGTYDVSPIPRGSAHRGLGRPGSRVRAVRRCSAPPSGRSAAAGRTRARRLAGPDPPCHLRQVGPVLPRRSSGLGARRPGDIGSPAEVPGCLSNWGDH
jgi:hypothetical protein